VHDAGHALLESIAAAILVAGGTILLVLAWRARLHGGSATLVTEPPASSPPPTFSAAVPATLSVAAAIVHFAATPAHVDELGLPGLAFAAAATFQAAWALAWLIEPAPGIARIGILGNVAIAAVWLVSRTVGMPIGPLAGQPEAVGGPDLFATILELALAGLLAARLGGIDRRLADRAARRLGDPRSISGIAVVPVIGIVMVATTLAVAGLAEHGHAPGAGHDARGAEAIGTSTGP
jgi:hypothetical protein